MHDRHAVLARGSRAGYYRIAAFLTSPQEHDFGAAQAQAVQERDELIDDARSKIGGGPNLERFNDALASNLSANFAWWNDDHNALFDRRLAIPPRRISLALAERLVDDGHLAAPEDIFFLFKSELFDLMDDGAGWARVTALIPDRRAFFEDGASADASCRRCSAPSPIASTTRS